MFNKIFLNFYYKRKIKEDVVIPALVKAPPRRILTVYMPIYNKWVTNTLLVLVALPRHMNTTTHKSPDSKPTPKPKTKPTLKSSMISVSVSSSSFLIASWRTFILAS